jgi:protein involved in sex pheromone biosynthesis
MKKTLILATVPALFAITACGETATEEPAETAAMDDDNDAPEPVAEEHHDDTEPHDESVPHEH